MVLADTNQWDAVGQFFVMGGVVTTALFAYLGARRSKDTNTKVQTNHGKRPGEYLELIADLVEQMKSSATKDDMQRIGDLLEEHTKADAENFEALRSQMEELNRGAA